MMMMMTQSYIITTVIVILGVVAAHFVTPSSASVVDAGDRRPAERNQGCAGVKRAYGLKGFNVHDVPSKMVSGEHLQICVQGFTCCTQEMEAKLALQSDDDFDKRMANILSFYRQNFVTQASKVDDFFLKTIDRSYVDLHDMFIRTYGPLYERNRQLFLDLFRDLESYYRRTDVSVGDVLDRFFSLLMQRMFQLMNDRYVFSEGFFNCIGEHMNQLKPFGEVPLKLLTQIKRSFTAARTFVEGLAVGRDVILAMSKIQPSHSCSDALTRLTYCPYCRGFTDAKPCNGYCLNVLKGCLAYHAEINHVWNVYIGELVTLAGRLEGPFNIELVVNPMGVKISEAIMTFQENAATFTSKVFHGCGEPAFRKEQPSSSTAHNETVTRREETTNEEEADENFNREQEASSSSHSIPESSRPTLERLIRDVINTAELTRDVWRKLPHVICNETGATPSEEMEDDCWNGLGQARYTHPIVKDGTKYQSNNEEVQVDPHLHHSLIERELYRIRATTGKLRLAHSGIDEQSDMEYYESGSGPDLESGSGVDDDGDSSHETKNIYVEISRTKTTSVDSDDSRILLVHTDKPHLISSAESCVYAAAAASTVLLFTYSTYSIVDL